MVANSLDGDTTMTSATKRSKIPSPGTEHPNVRVFLGQVLCKKVPISLLIDVLECARHAADEMSPELLEHVCGCKECLAASVAGACGSRSCNHRPDPVKQESPT
jgi:hypothetical protein